MNRRLRSEAASKKVDANEGPSFLNAFFDRGTIVFVRRDGDIVSYRRVPAEASCFIRSGELTRKLHRMLSQSAKVTGIAREDPYTRIRWRDRDEASSGCLALEREGVATFEGAVNPIRRFCADNRVHIAKPRRVYLDIETDSRVPFSRKETARILCWVLAEATADGDRVVARDLLKADTDDAETSVLNSLWRSLNDFDQVVAWNGDRFDFEVIKARSIEHRMRVNPQRWLWLDQLELFRRMNMMAAESGAEKQSFALNAIAMSVLGEGKAAFDASKTWEAWNTPPCRDQTCMRCRECLVVYCEKDTLLMPRIERKTGYIELLQTLCEVTGTFPDSRGINPGSQVDNFMLRLSAEKGYRFPTKHGMTVSEKFRGAYVMEPRANGITNNVHVCDFASLYPSIILSWNMSPETKLPRAIDECAIAAITNVAFRTDRQGILPIAVDELLRLRKYWSELQASLPPGTPEWVDAGRRSTAYKIAANSFYGVAGAPVSRIFDREVAESVTQCGVWLVQLVIEEAEKRGMRVIYADTDSAFVAGVPEQTFREFVGWCNESLFPLKLKERGCTTNRIKLAYEKEFERVVFLTAKRYVGRYRHYKGKAATEQTKPEVKGLEYKRGDASKFARTFQEQMVHKFMGYGPFLKDGPCEDPDSFEILVKEWKQRILDGDLQLEDVVVYKRLSKSLAAYPRRTNMNGSPRRDLPHVEIARELEKRGVDVGEGAKIGYFCRDGSKNPKTYASAEDWDGGCDRFDLWEKNVWPPTSRLLQAAFPDFTWSQHDKTRPKKQRAKRELPPPKSVETPCTRRLTQRRRQIASVAWGKVPGKDET